VTIFDSCPGLFGIPRAVAFLSIGLPYLQQLITAPFLYTFASFWTALVAIGLLPNPLREWYKSHNDDPGNAAEVRRMYIYSSTDALTNDRDVRAYAAEAKTKGFSAALEKFGRSAHVAHLRKDETRYWEVVRKTMEGSEP
jgi:hypothetical protein